VPASRSRLSALTPLFPAAPRGVRAVDPPSLSCFIATLPRSGSWLLAELLWNTSLVGEPHEYFRPDFTPLWSAEWDLRVGAPYADYVRTALAMTQTPNRVFCAKLHWYQFAWLRGQLVAADADRPSAGDWFPDLRHVFLHRTDTARQAISYQRAAATQAWFATDHAGDRPVVSQPDLQQVRWFEDVLVQHRESWRRYFADAGVTPLEIRYEELAGDPHGTVARVLAFLGLPHPGTTLPEPVLRPQADAATERVLELYRQAREHLEPLPAGLEWDRSQRQFRRADDRSSTTDG
jgi:LPS sulfotransferase NodH